MADTTEIRTRDLRARTPTRLPLRFLTPPTGVQADQAEKKTSPRNDGPTEIRTRDPRVRSPTLYRYATPPTPQKVFIRFFLNLHFWNLYAKTVNLSYIMLMGSNFG